MLKLFLARLPCLINRDADQNVDVWAVGEEQRRTRVLTGHAERGRIEKPDSATQPTSLVDLLASGAAFLAWESWRGWILHLGPPGRRWEAHSAKDLSELLTQVDELERQKPGLLKHVAQAAYAAAQEEEAR